MLRAAWWSWDTECFVTENAKQAVMLLHRSLSDARHTNSKCKSFVFSHIVFPGHPLPHKNETCGSGCSQTPITLVPILHVHMVCWLPRRFRNLKDLVVLQIEVQGWIHTRARIIMLFDIISSLKKNIFQQATRSAIRRYCSCQEFAIHQFKNYVSPDWSQANFGKGQQTLCNRKNTLSWQEYFLSIQHENNNQEQAISKLSWHGYLLLPYKCNNRVTLPTQLCWVVPYPCLKHPFDHWPSHAWQHTSIAW